LSEVLSIDVDVGDLEGSLEIEIDALVRSTPWNGEMRAIPGIRVAGDTVDVVPGVRHLDQLPSAVVIVDRLGADERIAADESPASLEQHLFAVSLGSAALRTRSSKVNNRQGGQKPELCEAKKPFVHSANIHCASFALHIGRAFACTPP